jgi:hypothetical protein
MMASGSKTIDEATRLALIGEMVGKMSAAISGALVLIGDKSRLCKALVEGVPAPPDDRAGLHLLPVRHRDVVEPDPRGAAESPLSAPTHIRTRMEETMRDMPKTMSLTNALAAIALFLPMAAHAAEGAVKVACGTNNCDLVSLGQICDTFSPGSEPIALSCENTATPGRGVLRACGAGGGTCRPFGGLVGGDLLGSYCFGSPIGADNDAVVMCDTTPEAVSPAVEVLGKVTGG